MKPRPKREWHLRNGATGRPGPGRPAQPAKVEPRALHFDKYEGNGAGRDMAAEIARAVFERNSEGICKAMTKRVLKGDHRAFTALANRGYGLAAQDAAHSQKAALTVEINFLGQRRRESLGVEKPLGAELEASNAIEGEVQELEKDAEQDAEDETA